MPQRGALVAILLVLDDDIVGAKAAIESVLGQEGPALELLLLDDERGRAEDLSHGERTTVVEAVGAGRGELIGRALESTEAGLIGLLRPSEVLFPGAVEALVATLAETPDAVLAHAWYQRRRGDSISQVRTIGFDLAYALRLHDFPIGPAALFRRRAIEQIGGPDGELDRAAVDDLWIRLAAVGSFLPVPEILAERRSPRPLAGDEMERMAAERVRLIDKVYGADKVTPEVAAVADQAYRNAFVYAATLAACGFNGAEERFYVADRLAPHSPDPETLTELDGRLMERIAVAAQLENELAWRTAAANHLRVGIAEREWKIDEIRNSPGPPPEPPSLVRRARRLTPAPLRPAVGRLARRVRPWDADDLR